MGQIISTIKENTIDAHKGNWGYQTHQPIIKVFGMELNVKAKNIPKEYNECGKLEIKLTDPNASDFLKPVTVRLCSSELDGRWTFLFPKRIEKEIMIEFLLVNTDTLWKTTKYPDSLSMKITDTVKEIKLNDIIFDVIITERKPDVQWLDINRLSCEESAFVKKRKEIVFKKMTECPEQFDITNSEDVPNIAIIGSGGGIRAAIGMSAAMTVLKERHTSEYAMYIAGLSGSAWYVLTLYATDDVNPNTVMENIRRNLHNFNGTKFAILLRLLAYYGRSILYGRSPTFTNLFGEIVSRILLKEQCTNKWSDRVNILNQGTVPLPLVAALHVRDAITSKEHGEWIEFSPYQVFIPRYGTAINMKHFGKRFIGGFCVERYNEKPIAFLQGMCGSAYTIGRDYMPSGEKGIMSFRCTRKLIRMLFFLFDNLLVAKVPNILYGIFEIVEDKDAIRSSVTFVGSLISKFLPIPRSLFEYQVNTVDVKGKNMKLVDAGIAFNSPYPTILRPSRKVDLILSFDFSQRGDDKKDPFEELIKAESWARQRKIPFPDIKNRIADIEKERGQKQYKEMYIFEEPFTPTILHFVTVNNSYRTNDDFDVFPAYNTLKFDYTRNEFNKLHYLVRHNVEENIETINKYIGISIGKKSLLRLSRDILNEIQELARHKLRTECDSG